MSKNDCQTKTNITLDKSTLNVTSTNQKEERKRGHRQSMIQEEEVNLNKSAFKKNDMILN
jgi:hypothetical protein